MHFDPIRHTCALLERAKHAHATAQSIVAKPVEIDALIEYFVGRQIVSSHTPCARQPLRLFGLAVLKANGDPWILVHLPTFTIE